MTENKNNKQYCFYFSAVPFAIICRCMHEAWPFRFVCCDFGYYTERRTDSTIRSKNVKQSRIHAYEIPNKFTKLVCERRVWRIESNSDVFFFLLRVRNWQRSRCIPTRRKKIIECNNDKKKEKKNRKTRTKTLALTASSASRSWINHIVFSADNVRSRMNIISSSLSYCWFAGAYLLTQRHRHRNTQWNVNSWIAHLHRQL